WIFAPGVAGELVEAGREGAAERGALAGVDVLRHPRHALEECRLVGFAVLAVEREERRDVLDGVDHDLVRELALVHEVEGHLAGGHREPVGGHVEVAVRRFAGLDVHDGRGRRRGGRRRGRRERGLRHGGCGGRGGSGGGGPAARREQQAHGGDDAEVAQPPSQGCCSLVDRVHVRPPSLFSRCYLLPGAASDRRYAAIAATSSSVSVSGEYCGMPLGPLRTFLSTVSASLPAIAGPTTPPRASSAWQVTQPFVTKSRAPSDTASPVRRPAGDTPSYGSPGPTVICCVRS